jgi:hypothetical protein
MLNNEKMKKKNLLMTAITIIGLATITSAQVPNYVPVNGLVGWWPFNGNANDESGNGNNGTVNGAMLTSDRFGVANKAYSFDGTSQNIVVANSSSLNVNEISIAVWYNANGGQMAVIAKNDQSNSTQYSYGMYHQFTWNSFGPGLYCSTGIGSCGITDRFEHWGIDGVIPSNEWVFVVYTIDNLGNSKTYFNSVLVESYISQNLISCNSPSSTLRFGGPHWYTYNMFAGLIDDIGIWNRALTPQEITDLYNGCQLSVNTQPTNQTININSNAQFVVSSSDPGATYQWQTDLGVGYQNLNSVGQYSGTTNDTLIVSNVTMSNNNQPFRCIITSGSCSDTSNVAVLTVNNNVGINEFTQDNLFSVFPNPAQSVINIKADTKLIGNNYSIYDNTGKVVLSGKLKSENTTIELSNLSIGIYMFRVGENMKQTFKVIKE